VTAYDPAANERAQAVLPASEKMRYASGIYEAAKDADAVLILTDWKDFAKIDLVRLNQVVRFPIVIDAATSTTPADAGPRLHLCQRRPAGKLPGAAGQAPAIGALETSLSNRSGRGRFSRPERSFPRLWSHHTVTMRVLVTGAAGFLGSHLTDRLLGEAIPSSASITRHRDRENIAHLANEPRFRFEQRDICEAFDPGPVDYVFNMASPASPRSICAWPSKPCA